MSKRITFFAILGIVLGSASAESWARDVRMTLPKRSHLTPVQRLNREGVEAVRKRQYEKAEAIFYKAYLYDAADPFTLNNLGYISEMEGHLNRAEKFYKLASEQDSDAIIDLSNARQLQGKPMTDALTTVKDIPMRVNRLNVQAIELLPQNRHYEADILLHQALALQPDNPFTLNNLGVAEEASGNYKEALKYYDRAAAMHSSEPIVVSLDRSWRGKPVSKMAANSARQLRKRMKKVETADAQSALLSFQGVAAMNRNDWQTARQDFLKAYSLNPNSAFTLNNLGYISEKAGDIETAQFYYLKARQAADASARIGLATQRSVEGEQLVMVASENQSKINREIDQYSQAERKQTGPVELIRRGAGPAHPAPQSNKTITPSPAASPASGPQVQK